MFNKLRFIATCALILISACVVLYFTHGQLQAQHSCFTKGTQISMANGSTKNIEDIIIGDEVFGFDEQTQTIVAQVVQRIDKPIRFHYVTVTFNDGSSLNMTEDHRVYSQNGWSAINPEKAIQNYGPIPTLVPFKIGDQILNLSGNLATATNFAYHYGPIQLYDLVNVSTTHNYFANNFLVHNCGCCGGDTASEGAGSTGGSSPGGNPGDGDGDNSDGDGGNTCTPSCAHCLPNDADYGYGLYSISCGSDGCGGSCGNRLAACSEPQCPAEFIKTDQGMTDINKYCYKMGDQSPYNITTDLAGRVECEHLKATRNPDKDNCQTYNNDGRDFWCYRRKSCAEQTPSYPQEYKYQYGVEGSGHNLDQYVFIPEPTGTIGGPHGYRCGIYKKQNRSWWQAVQANVYAAQHISNSSEHYVIKSTPTAICTGSQTPAAGLQQTGGGNVGGVSNYWTQRPASNTSAVNAFKVANDDLPDFNFFRQLYPKYNGIPSNGCLLDTDGYTICRYQDQRMSTLASTITSKYVVFIENDLIMDAPTPPLASNDFRAFIVGNKITFHDNIGKNSISANGCGPTDPAISCTNSQLQGIFVADAYEIPTHTDGIPTEILDFNPSVTCDQQTDVTGILISTNDLKLNQSFAGCQLNVGDLNYPNYNETKPVHTFCYHPNLLLQTPEWMKNTLDIRLETL